jgi:ABC-type uncharacterized transport system involved in gliding motility auxiliary subunit
MRERLEEYAPYITWFGLFLLLAGLLLPLLVPSGSGQIPKQLPWALIIIGGILTLAWPLLRPGDMRSALGSRRTRFGGNALILTISVIGALVVVNYLSHLRYWMFDLTANSQYSISRQTMQILDDLDDQDEALRLTAVMSSLDQMTVEDLEQLIDKYRARTGKIEYQLIDPDVDPLAVFELANRIDEEPTALRRLLVAEMGDEDELVYSGFDEQAVTEAIVKVMRPGNRRVLFTTGHGEYDPDVAGERSYNQIKLQLEREGYTVETVNLKTMTETLSADTINTIVAAGPQRPFLAEEVSRLDDYMAEGGALMVMLDSPLLGTDETGLEELLAPWDIQLQDDIVLQQSVFGSLSPTVIAGGDDYAFHTITKDLTDLGVDSVFPGSRSLLSGTPVTTTLMATEFVSVDGAVWGETNLEALEQGEAQPDEIEDNMPPLALAIAAEDTAEDGARGRLVVFGSSGIVADGLLQQFPPGTMANFDLFLNAVNWLAQEEELISIRPTEPDDRPVEPLDKRGQYLMLFTTVLLAPLVVLSAGAWIYWRRR